MTWYPQDPVDRINRFLKEQHDPQYQLKREMYPLPMLRNAREAHPPVVKDEGQGGPAPPEDLYGKQARLEERFANRPEKTGLDVLEYSKPASLLPEKPLKPELSMNKKPEPMDFYLHQFNELIKVP